MVVVEDNIDLGLIAKLVQKNNDEMRGLRREVADIRTLCVQTYDYLNRSDRRYMELRDDLELMIKMEVGGAITHVHSILENSLMRIEGKIADVSVKVDDLSGRIFAAENKH